jgi:hypothetical protein
MRYALGRLNLKMSSRRWAAALALSVAVGACGDDPIVIGPVEESLIEQFVGTWDAEVFDVTSTADTTIVADLMLNNGSFVLNVQPSGGYTATLTFGGFPLVEIGNVDVSEAFITLRPNGGEPATSSYRFLAEDFVRLEGSTDFDFNLDGDLDPADALIEIRRR